MSAFNLDESQDRARERMGLPGRVSTRKPRSDRGVSRLDQRLNVTGLLATKLHAILDRGTRRDFFDLYVLLHRNSLGIAECLVAIREVFRQHVNESLLLRALTYFDDAQREAPLPGEGEGDWAAVKEFFLTRVGSLLIPPARELEIQNLEVDVGIGSPEKVSDPKISQ